tara:strand:+ start:874 stop:999 length:126 start_codon:yes stop_codon:yes gene_type:complete
MQIPEPPLADRAIRDLGLVNLDELTTWEDVMFAQPKPLADI